jgi:tetratricopeptide (TPR) repeat protein
MKGARTMMMLAKMKSLAAIVAVCVLISALAAAVTVPALSPAANKAVMQLALQATPLADLPTPTTAASTEPAASGRSDETAQAVAASGDWSRAIDTYARELADIPVAGYRDKKDFAWIVSEYENSFAVQNKPVDYDPFRKILDQKLKDHPNDAIFTWRLHRALSDIAEKTQDVAAEKAELDAAIAAYPHAIEGDPSKHSSLQHLYNQYALIVAQSDVPAAEDYIRFRFKADARFVYFFTPPWLEFFQKNKMPEEYLKLTKDIVDLYDLKARQHPTQRQLLLRYKSQLEAERRQNPF